MATLNVKYKKGSNSEFMMALKTKIDNYFSSKNISKKANGLMVFKSIFFITLVFSSYSLIMIDQFNIWIMLILAIIFGLSTLCILFNIAHDAAHNAYSSNPRINKLLHLSFYFIGADPYIWKLKHNLNHHHNTNIPGFDWTVSTHGNSINYSAISSQSFISRYQYIYAPLLYPFYTLFLVFYKDFQMLFTKQIGNLKIIKHPFREYVILIVSKVFYLIYTLLLPMILLSITWWQVLLGFFIMHLFAGILLAIAAILPHLGEETTFPLPDKDGKIDHNWATHHIETTTDYSRTSLLANWFLGGLNAHTIHHLFPGICHIHYIPLTEILKETAAEFNVDYKETTLWGAIKSHIQFLKKLGATGYKHGQLVLESK